MQWDKTYPSTSLKLVFFSIAAKGPPYLARIKMHCNSVGEDRDEGEQKLLYPIKQKLSNVVMELSGKYRKFWGLSFCF